jgi:hypothetical protein
VRVVDLKAIVEPAVRKHLRRKEANYDFSIFGSANGEPAHVTINDRGLIKARVMVMAHDDPYEMFDVTFQVVNHKDGALAERECRSVARTPSVVITDYCGLYQPTAS